MFTCLRRMIIITIETAFKEIFIKIYKGYSLSIMLKLLHKDFWKKNIMS